MSKLNQSSSLSQILLGTQKINYAGGDQAKVYLGPPAQYTALSANSQLRGQGETMANNVYAKLGLNAKTDQTRGVVDRITTIADAKNVINNLSNYDYKVAVNQQNYRNQKVYEALKAQIDQLPAEQNGANLQAILNQYLEEYKKKADNLYESRYAREVVNLAYIKKNQLMQEKAKEEQQKRIDQQVQILKSINSK